MIFNPKFDTTILTLVSKMYRNFNFVSLEQTKKCPSKSFSARPGTGRVASGRGFAGSKPRMWIIRPEINIFLFHNLYRKISIVSEIMRCLKVPYHCGKKLSTASSPRVARNFHRLFRKPLFLWDIWNFTFHSVFNCDLTQTMKKSSDFFLAPVKNFRHRRSNFMSWVS